MAEKVYCENCLFFLNEETLQPPFDFGYPDHAREKCLAPQNFKDTHRESSSKPITQPKIINKYNNCIWYVDASDSSSSCSEIGQSSSSCLQTI